MAASENFAMLWACWSCCYIMHQHALVHLICMHTVLADLSCKALLTAKRQTIQQQLEGQTYHEKGPCTHTWLGFSPPAVLANLESLNCSFASGSLPVMVLL